MKIYIVPMQITGFQNHNIAIRMRAGEPSVLFMNNVIMSQDGTRGSTSYAKTYTTMFSLTGDVTEGLTLEDGDALLVQSRPASITNSVVVEVEKNGECYISKGTKFNPISMAARMEKRLCVCIADAKYKNDISTAIQIYNKAAELYNAFPPYKNIMVKDDDGSAKEVSLLELVDTQEDAFMKWSESMILSMDAKYETQFPVAKQILEKAVTHTGFSLLSREEQVAAFLEFSKKHADTAVELVPDNLIEYIQKSPEYGHSLLKMEEAGLKKSATQQFNVLQQVGYFGGRLGNYKKSNVIYNLSDMGAGKTMMTVQAIYTIDCMNIGAWIRRDKNESVRVGKLFLPDKHIVAPALSVKSSWVDTFKLFYEIEKIDDFHYMLTMEYGGVTAESHLYIAPFTVRSGKVFVQKTLPEPACKDTYLIIDEIHQLVRRHISRTKFFVPKITPVETYHIFALSGTMSNLKAGEWLSLIRFLGDTDVLNTPQEAKKVIEKLEFQFKDDIKDVSEKLEQLQHRKFNTEDITMNDRYVPEPKKKSGTDESYFMTYGTKLIVPRMMNEVENVKDILSQKRYGIMVEPEESDNVSFELFYRIAASSAITAQSLQVAEELFGEQKTQYKSSIIKTMSPFTDEEVMLLDTLHKIAADSAKYRSANIGRDINNAILNLNDGLQQKDLYALLSTCAERNVKFLEYLASLDVNVMERLPKTGLIKSPRLEDTHKFHVLKELLEKDKDETFLIVVNDFYAMKKLAETLGVSYLSKQELKDEMAYQELLDGLFAKQNIVIVTQDMIKSSLDLVQANRLVQYQLNTEVSDIIQTQNRINRIGQTRETRCYYIAADRLQNALIELFLDSYRNIRVAHKGIVELFADLSSQIDVINDYLNVAFKKLSTEGGDAEPEEEAKEPDNDTDLLKTVTVPKNVLHTNGICNAILFPKKEDVCVIIPLASGKPFELGVLKPGIVGAITGPTRAVWNLKEMRLAK